MVHTIDMKSNRRGIRDVYVNSFVVDEGAPI